MPSVRPITSPTTYEQHYTRINSTAWKFDVLSNLVTLKGRLDSGPVTHHLTAATNGFRWSTYNGNPTHYTGDSTSVLGEASLDHPRSFAKPDTPTLPHYKSSTVSQQNVMVGDSLDFGQHYTLSLNAGRQFFHSSSWNAQGKRTGKGSDQGNSANIAFMYKPSEAITTYVAYATSLQIGGMAPQGASNAYQLLSPIRNHQLEVGIKTHVGGMDLNGALFHVTRPLDYTGDNGVYGVQGKQRNNGAEFWANGNLTDRLRLMGGVTWIDAELVDAIDEATANKRVVGVPRYQANLLAEYDLATLPGVTLTSNVHFTGKRAADPTNQSWASGYTTLDAGVRYVNPDIHGHRLNVGLMVDNLTNRRYWAGIFPSSIYGDTGSNYTAFLGQPRTATLSASVSF